MRTLPLLLLLATPARAALPPCVYDEMVREAVTVIQIADTTVTRLGGRHLCEIRGTVIRSFRGTIAPGTAVMTSFDCINPALGSDTVPIGGSLYFDAETVAAAPVVEIHGQAGGGVAGYGAGMLLLPAATEEIAYPYDDACE